MEHETRTKEVKLVAIGNSRGIRLPREMIAQYGWSESITVERSERGVLLRGRKQPSLSWKETYQAMAAADEDWSDFDAAAGDGID